MKYFKLENMDIVKYEIIMAIIIKIKFNNLITFLIIKNLP